MRIGSSNPSSSGYESQNNELKRLHEERLKRQQQQKTSQQHPSQSQSQNFTKELKTSDFNKQDKYPRSIFLNSLLSDPRGIKEKVNTISISSFFQDDPRTFGTTISKNVKSVFMTTYGYVMDVLSNIAESGVPFVLVNDSSENGPGNIERNYCGFKNMSLVTPPRNKKGYGVFHTKLWLIRFSTFLRVVICTGNQHAEDWLVWLNSYWYQDFSLNGMKLSDFDENKQASNLTKKTQIKPDQDKVKTNAEKVEAKSFKSKKSVISLDDSDDEVQIFTKQEKKKVTQKPQETKIFDFEKDFKQTLKMVLKNMMPTFVDFEKQTGINLDKYDFSNPEVVLIPSIPGTHKEDMEEYGMAKLKRVMKSMGPKIKKGSLSYNTSSLGNVESNFLKNLYFSFMPFAESFSTSNYKIIFPTQKYIIEKTCGEAQVLFLKKENYYKSDIKKEVFYHYEPSEKNAVAGAIPHLKTVIVENLDPQSQEEKNQCIFFMGSHNMTKAAWGSYQKSNFDSNLDESQIAFSNSELGILFLKMEKEKLLNFLPYKYPARKYQDYDKPFFKD